MKILIWTMGRALGDGVIYTGFPREIKKKYPNSEIHIFCTKMHATAFRNNPYVDKFYYFNTYNKPFNKIKRTKIFLNPLLQLKNLLKARKEKYDILIDVDSSYKWSNRCMIKFIMGNYKKENRVISGRFKENNKYGFSKEYLYKIYTHIYDQEEGSPYSYLFNDKLIDAKYELYIDEDSSIKAMNFFKSKTTAGKIIIFNGEGSDKSISEKKIIATLTALLKNFPAYYFFILGYSAYFDKYNKIVNTINNEHLQLTYETNIDDTFALIKHSDLVISVDTALIHIASAVGTNVCEIVSYGKKGNFVGKPKYVEYIICESKTKEFNLDMYNIEDVINAVQRLT